MCHEEITFKKHHIHYFYPLKFNVMNIYETFTIVTNIDICLNLNQDMNMVKRRSIVKVIDALFILNDLLYVYMYISIIVIVDLKCVICSYFYYI